MSGQWLSTDKEITVLISSSPIPSHPSPSIINETIASVRYHLPDARILVMVDGVREEQENRRPDYRDYQLQLVRDHLSDKNFAVLPFAKFTHQAVMTMTTMDAVFTPFMLFLEHDTPLVDKPIDWKMLKNAIRTGVTNHVRLHYDEEIHPDHQHMMHGYATEFLIKTTQWHQRPHLAQARWYQSMLQANFDEKTSRTFIEDKIYSPVSCAPWEDYRLTVYDPEGTGKNMKRSRDLNGRSTDPKYPMVF